MYIYVYTFNLIIYINSNLYYSTHARKYHCELYGPYLMKMKKIHHFLSL